MSSNYIEINDCFDIESNHPAVVKGKAKATLTNKTADWKGFQADLQEKITLNVRLKTTEHKLSTTLCYKQLHNKIKIKHLQKSQLIGRFIRFFLFVVVEITWILFFHNWNKRVPTQLKLDYRMKF